MTSTQEPVTNNDAGQTTIIQGGPVVQMAPAPRGASIASSQPPAPGVNPHYNAVGGRMTGMIQLACGVSSIILGFANIAVYTALHRLLTGIWTGLLFFSVAGILGVISAKRSTCVIISYMVMSILSAIFAGLALPIYGFDLLHIHDFYYGKHFAGAVIVLSLLLLVALVELVTAIAASILSCCGSCCAPRRATNAPVAYYYRAVPAGYAMPQVAVALTTQQAVPGAPGVNYVQQPAMQHPSGQPPAQWQPMMTGQLPPLEEQPMTTEKPPPYS